MLHHCILTELSQLSITEVKHSNVHLVGDLDCSNPKQTKGKVILLCFTGLALVESDIWGLEGRVRLHAAVLGGQNLKLNHRFGVTAQGAMG